MDFAFDHLKIELVNSKLCNNYFYNYIQERIGAKYYIKVSLKKFFCF